MKLQVSFKTPDAVDDAIKRALKYEPDSDAREDTKDALYLVADDFVRHGEMITVEFCTETHTATVLPK